MGSLSPAAVIVNEAGTNIAEVKAASTAAVAADKAVVVAVSPNNIIPTQNAAASQADGHSASLGATADADTALTVIGRLKQLLTRLPAALVGGRLDSNIGAWLGSTAPTVGQKAMAAAVPVAIASDQSTLTVSQMPAEEETYTAVVIASPMAGAKSMISIFNPVGSAKLLKLREIYIRNASTTAVTGVVVDFRILRWAHTTAPTGGTAVTARAHDTNDTLAAGVDVRTGGTLGGTEEAEPLDIMRMSSDEWGPGTLDVEASQQSIANYLPARAKRDSSQKPFTIRPGEGIHLKQITVSTAGAFDIIFVFTETSA